MSRHLITANSTVFEILDEFCALRGLALKNAAAPRWIASESKHRHFMINSELSESISFSPSRKLARFGLDGKSYICAIGFEQISVCEAFVELALEPAHLTVALAELKPKPKGTLSEIRQVVEIADKFSDRDYNGHHFEGVASIFPTVRFFAVERTSEDEIWDTFFRFCIDECEFGTSWIEGHLADTLRSICELDPRKIPYRVLCRSVFDGDPSSFFLALYRCLEALYSYSGAKNLVAALDISREWGIVAAALEDQLNWHPHEEGSLISIVKYSSFVDQKNFLSAFGEIVDIDDPYLTSKSARKIYWLRNSIVHYRPAQHRISLDDLNWSVICISMTGIVLDVYNTVFN